MAYALLQKRLAANEVEKLKRAFRAVPTLSELDAQNAAHEAHGIFLRGLDVESASALQDALFQEGVGTWVVAESELPAIPPAKVIQQVELLPHHITMHDPMHRTCYVPWGEILLLAAGEVRLQELKRVRASHELPQSHTPGIAEETVDALKTRTELSYHLLLEIVLLNGEWRYSINADEFVFDHLGSRFSDDQRLNFIHLVRDLVKHAPSAGLNRGAYRINQDKDEVVTYPSKTAFYSELTWMLWRIEKLARREDL